MPGNPEDLRRRVDAGDTRDKIDFPDPAAAPLGTDAEAGGAAPAADDVAAARTQETRPTAGVAPARSDESARTISGEMKRGIGVGASVAVAAAAVVVVALAAVMLA